MQKYRGRIKRILLRFKAGGLALLRYADNWISDRFGPLRIIFVVRNEIGFVNQAQLIRELQKYPGIFIATVSDGDTPGFQFGDPDLQAFCQAYELSAKRAVFKKWHYLISTDIPNLYFRRDAIHVKLGHGCGFGNGYRKDDWLTHQIVQPNVHFVFAMSSSLRPYVEAQYPDAFDPAKKLLFVTGSLKLDLLATGHYSRSDTLADFGLDPERQTILVSSHWKEEDMLRKFGSNLLDCLCPLSDRFNIILTAHPRIWELPETADFSPAGLYRELQAIAAGKPNIVIYKGGNPLPLLNAADLLISGNSSIRIEYACFDRPALFYQAQDRCFVSPHVQMLYQQASYVFSDLDGLPALVLKAFGDADTFSVGNQALRRYFSANIGRSAAVMAEMIRKIGRISGPRSPNWRQAQAISDKTQA